MVEKADVLLTANYIFPDRAADAKAKIDAALAAGDYDSITAPEAFAEKLTSDLQSVTHDKHVRVFPPPAPRPAAGATTAPARAPQRVYAGFSRVDRLKGNIGYIKLLNFPDSAGPFGQTANQAITDLAGSNALIIDMRDNGGGSPDGIAYLCSFFFDPKTPVHINGFVNRKSGTNEFSTEESYMRPVPVSYLGKPVYLLTSKRTFSGGRNSFMTCRRRRGPASSASHWRRCQSRRHQTPSFRLRHLHSWRAGGESHYQEPTGKVRA